ncbi:Predicted arabinose efflux permease, MFS family [Nocardioides exalbidus]|uniref:Predicted arabinose efflux permease, MFS family n=1 Tax=Nocardioides exalbidus TaxID=402596 RepID=A0A1H4Y269_9ACTN|nr:MFS transporter [Nocardioides exalbidus]SED11188.1 Predicted arabinose efflux permease, MFS family [Nocardioides exalbidus]
MISPSFARYWRASAVSGFGTYVTLFALQALVVLTLDGTASDVGWLNAVRWLPYLVVGIVVGALVDGRRRLPLMVGTDVVQAVLLLAIPLLWWLDVLTLPVLLVVVAAYGTAAVVNSSASMSFLPRIVGREDLQRAHARIDGADAVATTSGPAIGGLLVSLVGAPVAVLVDSLTYLYSALTLRRIEHEEPPARAGLTVRGLLADIGEGIRWAYGRSGLATLAINTHGWFLAHAVVGVVLAPYAFLVLDLSAVQLGVTGAVGGVGAVVGTLVTTAVGRRLGTGWTIILCHAITTVAVVTYAVAGQVGGAAVVVLALGQLLYGLAMGMSNSHEMSYRQLVTPDELQARTNTTLRSLNRAVVVVASPIAGILADAWGITPVLVLSAVLFGLVTLSLAATPFRNVRAPV